MPNPPNVTNVSPGSGPVTGNMPVIITGTDFLGAIQVQFGSVNAAFTVVSNTQIMATAPVPAPAGQTQSVHVRVKTANGQSTTGPSSQFAYYDPTPVLTGVNPANGPQGSPVLLYGNNFFNITTVTFDGTAALFVINSPTQITATAPNHAVGGAPVIVTNPSGASGAVAFTYAPGVPTVTSIYQTSGREHDLVTIMGTGFVGVTSVNFEPVANPAIFTVVSLTQITATAPGPPPPVTNQGPPQQSIANVRVTNSAGQSANSAANRFDYG